jgi:hypothetical protein
MAAESRTGRSGGAEFYTPDSGGLEMHLETFFEY